MSSSTPLVSVIFTSYNHKSFVQQALESILSQTYQNLEVIVVDDCSTDGSSDILKQYATDSRVKLHLLKSNTGSYVKASNFGADFANGDFLLFAQCDDFADTRQLETIMNVFGEYPDLGVVYSRSNMVDKSGQIFDTDFTGRSMRFKERCATDTYIDKEEMRNFLSYSCVIPNLSAAVLKKGLYLGVNKLPENYQVAADWAFWLAMSEKADFYYLAESLNNFRQHDSTIRSRVKIEKQIIEIYSLLYDHIKQYKLSGSPAKNIRLGAGLVWFTYAFEGFNAWIRSFIPVLSASFKYEKFNVFYLIAGGYLAGREFIQRKLVK